MLSDPPTYGQATQTPPVLYGNDARPSTLVVKNVSAGETLDINVEIRSEDDGEDLQARLILNHSIAGDGPYIDYLLDAVPVDPGSLNDDKRREISTATELPSGLPKGCHQLTLWVTHVSNLEARAKRDIATVTWWLNVDDDSTTPETTNQLRNCPQNTGSTN